MNSIDTKLTMARYNSVPLSLSADQLTSKEIRRLREVFILFDTKRNDLLDTRELKNALRAFGSNPTSADVNDFIKEFDADHDGSLNFEEFMSALEPTVIRERDNTNRLLNSFRYFDRNGNGTISEGELTRTLSSFGDKLTVQEVRTMIKLADVNNDGLIDYEEFCTILNSDIPIPFRLK